MPIVYEKSTLFLIRISERDSSHGLGFSNKAFVVSDLPSYTPQTVKGFSVGRVALEIERIDHQRVW